VIFTENDCERSKILWYQFDFKRAIFVEVVTAYVSNTEKAHWKILIANSSKSNSLIFLSLRQLVCSVMYIMPLFPVFQELPDFARFFGKTGFRKNYLSLS